MAIPTTVQDYLEQVRKELNVIEQASAGASGLDERIDWTNKLLVHVANLLSAGLIFQLPKPSPTGEPPYNVRTLELDTAKTTSDPFELELSGDILTFFTDGSYTDILFALDSPANDWVPLIEFGNPYRYSAGFQKIYLAWSAQSDKYLRIHIGREAGAAAGVQITTETSLPKASEATPTAVSVNNTSTSILSADSNRVFAVFVNDSNEAIYLALGGTAVMNEGIRLNATGGAYEINQTNLYTGVVTAICSSGGKVLTVTEGGATKGAGEEAGGGASPGGEPEVAPF